MLLPARPCLPLSLLTFLGFHFHGLLPLPLLFLTSAVFAFFRPLQFWILTTQPLFLPFPLLPVSASQWLPQCSALPFGPAVFPVLPCLVSRAFFPGSRYSASLYVSFHPSLTRSHSCSSGAYLPLSLPVFSVPPLLPFGRFRFPSGYSASASSFLPSGRSASQSALRPGSVPYVPFALPLHSRLVSRPLPSGSAYSVLCSFPFVLPCFAPTAVPQVLPFWISPPGSVPDFRFLSSASIVASHYSAYPLFLSALFPSLPHSWLPRCFCSALASQILPLLPGLVSRAFLPVPCTRLPVCFLSSFPASLPQLFHWCFPFRFPLRDQRLASVSFRPHPL